MSPLTILFILFASVLTGFATPLALNTTSFSVLVPRIVHVGRGTWFDVGLGNCGGRNVNSDHILAISIQRYGDGSNCDQWVQITNNGNGKTAYGQTRDSCESCGMGDIDLSPSLFELLDNLSVGELSVSWHFMPKGWSP